MKAILQHSRKRTTRTPNGIACAVQTVGILLKWITISHWSSLHEIRHDTLTFVAAWMMMKLDWDNKTCRITWRLLRSVARNIEPTVLVQAWKSLERKEKRNLAHYVCLQSFVLSKQGFPPEQSFRVLKRLLYTEFLLADSWKAFKAQQYH